jgi:Cu(I)/Ag(I) efflux system membrane fusion protein
MNNYNTQPAVEKATEVYTCSMHPEIIHEPGNCPICGMNLVKKRLRDNRWKAIRCIILRPTDKFVVGTFKLQQQRIRLSVVK